MMIYMKTLHLASVTLLLVTLPLTHASGKPANLKGLKACDICRKVPAANGMSKNTRRGVTAGAAWVFGPLAGVGVHFFGKYKDKRTRCMRRGCKRPFNNKSGARLCCPNCINEDGVCAECEKNPPPIRRDAGRKMPKNSTPRPSPRASAGSLSLKEQQRVIKVGQRVRLDGTRTKEFNGTLGTTTEYIPRNGLWVVKLDRNDKLVAVKPLNLKVQQRVIKVGQRVRLVGTKECYSGRALTSLCDVYPLGTTTEYIPRNGLWVVKLDRNDKLVVVNPLNLEPLLTSPRENSTASTVVVRENSLSEPGQPRNI